MKISQYRFDILFTMKYSTCGLYYFSEILITCDFVNTPCTMLLRVLTGLTFVELYSRSAKVIVKRCVTKNVVKK